MEKAVVGSVPHKRHKCPVHVLVGGGFVTNTVISLAGERSFQYLGVFVRSMAALMLVFVCQVIVDRPLLCAQLLCLQGGAARYEVAPYTETLKDPGGSRFIDQLVGASFTGAFSSGGDGNVQPVHPPVIATMIGDQDGVAEGMLRSALIAGILFGISLYSLIMFTALRERSYLWHSLFFFLLAGCFALNHSMSIAYFSGLPVGAVRKLAQLSLGGSIIFLGCFARRFMDTSSSTAGLRRVDRLLLLIILQGGLLTLLASVGKGRMFEVAFAFLALGCVPVMLAACLMAWRRGVRRARWLFLASVAAGGCGLLYLFVFLRVLPFTKMLSNLFEFGCICAVGGLVCALGDRVQALRRESETLRVSERRHKQLAFTDALTGLFNMRYFRIQLDLEIRRSQQLQQSFTLMMMDVDNFKLFNDCYGHLEGDRVLRHLGGLISSVIREQDVACRYGGEEFAVILPGSQPEAAISIHTRLQMALLQWAKQGRAGVPHLITLSVGVAENMPGEGAEDLIERADSAMYAAKQGGRDQLVLSQAGDLAEEVTYQDCYTNY